MSMSFRPEWYTVQENEQIRQAQRKPGNSGVVMLRLVQGAPFVRKQKQPGLRRAPISCYLVSCTVLEMGLQWLVLGRFLS